MRRAARQLAAAFAAAALAVPCPVFANDSTAELATGGLIFVKNPNVAMRSERLSISPAEIRVRYVFANTAGQDITSTVAFPMPDIAFEGPDDNIAIPDTKSPNLLAFSTVVDGRPVTAQVEQKTIAKGVDQTALLVRLGVPLAPYLPQTGAALDRLPPAQWDELVRLGLAEVNEYDAGKGMQKHLEPRWTFKETYFWQQTFPAGREIVIEHRYKPSLGGSVQTSLGEPNWDGLAEYRRKYCIEDDLLAAIGRARQAAHTTYGGSFSEQRIAYVLKTGANWAGPIGDFTLTVDKGAPNNLVSFCATGVKKTGPTRFEVHYSDYTPAADLAILLLQPLPRR